MCSGVEQEAGKHHIRTDRDGETVTTSTTQNENLLFLTLLQLIVMVGAARYVHTVFRRLGQPGVIGEIVAGLLLGPSLIGYFFPVSSRALFGAHASAPITVISQIGLILLMFQIGMDFEFGHLGTQRNRRAAAAVTVVSVSVPLGVGTLLGWVSAPVLAPAIDPVCYSLFLGLGMAITAVPILGRILRQYGLTRTEVGVVAISAAAINDVTGWILLSVVSAYAAAQFSVAHLSVQLFGLLAFVLLMWFALRPAAVRLLRRYPTRNGAIDPNLMAIVVCMIFALGICTYELGIFAIFGGFAGGVLFHRDKEFVEAWRSQVGRFVLVFFLPVFFTYTGLRTNVLGLTTASDWEWLTILLTGAVVSKIVPVYWAGRACGFDRNQSSILGTLMNTRALMELIVLNIGFDLGLIPQKVFTMLVIMAVVTTLMAGPLLKRLLTAAGHEVPAGLEA
jgi:Kef-type K+ transport system membrane component KefB